MIQMEFKERIAYETNYATPMGPVLLLCYAIGQLVVTHVKEMPAFRTGKGTQIRAISASFTINMAA